MFAKLYDTEKYGQILVKIEDSCDGPEVRYFYEPEGLGVCSIASVFESDINGSDWDKAEAVFNKSTEEYSVIMIDAIQDQIRPDAL